MGDVASDTIVLMTVLGLLGCMVGALFMGQSEKNEDDVVRRARAYSGLPVSTETNPLLRRRSSTLFRQAESWFPSISLLLIRAGNPLPLTSTVIIMASLFAVASLISWGLFSATLTTAFLFGALAGGVLPYLTLKIMADRRQEEIAVQFPAALDVMAHSLEMGHPTTVALGVVAKSLADPIAAEFQQLVDELTYGLSSPDAMENFCRRVPSSEARFLAAAIELQRGTGGSLGEILSNIAAIIRDRRAMKKKASALSSGSRLSGIIVAFVPVFLVAIIHFIRPQFFSEVADMPAFQMAMGAAALFVGLGLIIIYRLVNFRV